jgi:ribose/xylose/arabinose/galactoside ABC-type transport system permease subunit
LALLAGVTLAVGIGLLNGVLVAWGHMPAIIVTLATMGVARGVGLIYSGATRSRVCRAGLPGSGGPIGMIPVPVIHAAGLCIGLGAAATHAVGATSMPSAATRWRRACRA